MSFDYKKYFDILEKLNTLVPVQEDKIELPKEDKIYIPDFISIAGGYVEKGDLHSDHDIIIRLKDRDESLEVLLNKTLFKDTEHSTTFIYNPAGPHTDYIPLIDLVLRFKKELKVRKVGETGFEALEAIKTLKPLQIFIPAKTKGAYTLQEYYDLETLYTEWAKPYLDEGKKLDVETKYNGWRCVIEKDRAGKTLIYFEDSKIDRSKQFPDILNDLKLIKEPLILDSELGAIGTDGKPLARVDLAIFGVKGKLIPKNFITPGGIKGRLVAHCFDCLYYKEDIHELPWTERRKVLEEIISGHDFDVLKISDIKIVNKKKDLFKEINRRSKLPGSEGAVIKVTDSKYFLTGQIPGWAKIKNVVEIKVKVLGRTLIKGATNIWNYDVGYGTKKGIEKLTKTFNTSLDAKTGDIITISVEEVIPKYNEKENYWSASVVCPRVKDIELGRRLPYTTKEIIQTAWKANILQISPELVKKLRADKILESFFDLVKDLEVSWSPGTRNFSEIYGNFLIEGRGITEDPGQEEILEIFELAFSESLEEGQIDYKEGDAGVVIFQTHERGLSEDQTKYTHDFGWNPVRLTSSQASRLNNLSAFDWLRVHEKETDSIRAALKKIDYETLSVADKKTYSLVDPVSIHTDIRFWRDGDNFFEGGEVFTPGNQFKENKLKDPEPDKKMRGNFKVPRKGSGKVGEIIRGPISWMKKGLKVPSIEPPGAPGSTATSWSRFYIRDKFRFKCGVQDPHFKEFWFSGGDKKRNGRWIWTFAPIEEKVRAWLFFRPKTQEMKSERSK